MNTSVELAELAVQLRGQITTLRNQVVELEKQLQSAQDWESHLTDEREIMQGTFLDIVAWAINQSDEFRQYREMPSDWVAPEDWTGSTPGLHGGEIHLIAQSDSEKVFAETTDDFFSTDYVICAAGVSHSDPVKQSVHEAIKSVLSVVFGSTEKWRDNYAQTEGWYVGTKCRW